MTKQEFILQYIDHHMRVDTMTAPTGAGELSGRVKDYINALSVIYDYVESICKEK